MPRTTRFPDVPNQVHAATAHYDFALDGGAEGEITLPGQFPSGALFINGICHILESLAGVGTTIGLKIGDADIVPGEVVANWNAGLKVTDVLNAENGYNPALLDEDNYISIVIAGGDLTAGKIAIHLIYIMSPAMPVQLDPPAADEPPADDPPADDPPADDPPADEPPEECEPVADAAAVEQPQRRSHHRKKNEDEE